MMSAESLTEAFKIADKDKDGKIKPSDIKHLMVTLGIKIADEEALKLVGALGSTQASLGLDEDTFMRYFEPTEEKSEDHESAKDGWPLVCQDPKGVVSAKQLKSLFDKIGMMLSDEEVGELVMQYDKSKKGGVNHDEFCCMFSSIE